MGPYAVEDGTSVVDPDGKIRGIEGLHVADASIMIGEYMAARVIRARP